MANKNLFTKFASLAMAGALAFSAVPVAGLNGVFDAQASINGNGTYYWNPEDIKSVSDMVSITDKTDDNVQYELSVNDKFVQSGYVFSTSATYTAQSNGNVSLATPGSWVYTIKSSDGVTNMGTAKITVNKRSLNNATFELKNKDDSTQLTYNGLTQRGTIKTDGDWYFEDQTGKKVKIGADSVYNSGYNYYITDASGVDAATYTNGKVSAGSLGTLKDSKTFNMTIGKFQLSDTKKKTTGEVVTGDPLGTVSVTVDQAAYTGSELRPNVTVKAVLRNAASYTKEGMAVNPDDTGVVTLVNGTDYSVNYVNAVGTEDGGTGSVEITGKGKNFEGNLTSTFKIVKKDNSLANAKVTLMDGSDKVENNAHLTYNGKAQWLTPVVEMPDKTAANGYRTLTCGTDYTVKYENGVKSEDDDTAGDVTAAGFNGKYTGAPKSASTVTMTIEPKAGSTYADKITRTYVIDPLAISKGFEASVKNSYDVTYDGKEKKPDFTVKTDGIELNGDATSTTKALDYEVTYDNNVNAGKGTATFVGRGNYTGTATQDFDINKRSISDSSVEVSDIANQVYTGSAVEPGVEVKYTNADKKEFVLVEGEDYTVKYTDNTNTTTNASAEITGIGNFENSTSKTFKIVEADKNIENAEVTLTAPTVQYDGKYHTASVKSVKIAQADGTVVALDRDKDYSVKTVTEKEVGVYDVVIKAKGDVYGGSVTVPFEITGYDVKDAGFSLKKTSVKYNGKNQKPELVVAEGTRYDGKDMVEGTDYEVSGIKNIKNVGKLTVKVTGLGAYAGTEKSLTFKVTKADQPMKVSTKTASVKASKVAKKNQTIKASKVFSVSKNQGSVSYKKTSGNSKIKVASNGKITVKKGLKKGTYKVKVKVTAKGNSNYNSGNKTVKATIKVK